MTFWFPKSLFRNWESNVARQLWDLVNTLKVDICAWIEWIDNIYWSYSLSKETVSLPKSSLSFIIFKLILPKHQMMMHRNLIDVRVALYHYENIITIIKTENKPFKIKILGKYKCLFVAEEVAPANRDVLLSSWVDTKFCMCFIVKHREESRQYRKKKTVEESSQSLMNNHASDNWTIVSYSLYMERFLNSDWHYGRIAPAKKKERLFWKIVRLTVEKLYQWLLNSCASDCWRIMTETAEELYQ